MLNLLLGILISAIPLPPKPANFVTDNAGALDAARSARLEQKLIDFERRTSDQVLVYVDRKVPEGTTLEEMGSQAIRQWGVGRRGRNNGVILFLFTEDRKIRIEVGYGLEGSLTDAKSKQITSVIMKPRLQQGDFGGAVEHGVDAIVNTISGESYKGNGMTVAEADAEPSKGLIVAMVAVMLFAFGLLAFALVAFIRTLRRNPRAALASGSSTSSWSDGSSDSGSSGGGDFSGGGGDGGGGGASDSW